MRERRVLFFDLADVEARQNVVQAVCEAEKHPNNPVLPLGDHHEWDSLQARPWEGRTVLYDEEERLFKCWYAGKDVGVERWWNTGYAVSDDGVHWEKPKLGLHEYRGRSDNNICLRGWGPVVKDLEEDDPARRYKMIVKGPPRERMIRAGYSPDGIHWTEEAQVDLPEWDGGAPDIVALLKDEQEADASRRWKMIWQAVLPNNKHGPERVRVKHIAFGPDLEHLTASADNPVLHPNDSTEQENHYLMLAPYAGQYVMPYEYGWYVPNGTGRFGMYCADIRLAVSRDGEHFSRVQTHQPLIRRGVRGDWDSGSLVIADKLVEHNDRMYLYYCGNGEDWTQLAGREYSGRLALAEHGGAAAVADGAGDAGAGPVYVPGDGGPGDAGIRGDAAVHGGGAGARLSLNISDGQPLRGWVEVEVLPAEGDEPLAGFSRDDCRPLCRDGLREPVSWRERRWDDLGTDAVRLRVHFCGAVRLHALNFSS